MKNLLRFMLPVLISGLSLLNHPAFAQGSLTPPGAPAPVMKTLSQVEPRTPIYVIPTNLTVSGSYYLTTNLAGTAAANGIIIGVSDVTVDLNGFTLTGPGNTGIIYSGTRSNIVIKNGMLRNWSINCIDSSGGYHTSLEHLKISGCGGVGVVAGEDDTISYCTAVGNVSTGISAGFYNRLDHCAASENGGNGIALSVQDELTDSVACFNKASGIFMASSGSLVSGCNCSANISSGIYINNSRCVALNNLANNNNFGGSAGHAGIFINDSNSRVDGNSVVGNGNAGIAIGSGQTVNIVVRNTASAQANNYITQSGNDVGPIGTAAASTSPWANISN